MYCGCITCEDVLHNFFTTSGGRGRLQWWEGHATLARGLMLYDGQSKVKRH